MKKQANTKQTKTTKRTRQLRVVRETVKVLDDDDLGQVAGGGEMSRGWVEC